jgi:AcrR family transcriptional regulator
MARTTKEEAQKTRQRILDTAIALFNRDGVSVTTLEKIAEAAALTRGAIYWHFKNKMDVITAIHEALHISILEGLHKELQDTNRTAVERMKAAIVNFLTDLAQDELEQMVMTIFTIKCDYSGEMGLFLDNQATCKKEGFTLFHTNFQEALDKGEIQGSWSAEFLSRNLQYYICGIITDCIKDKTLHILKEDAEKFVNFFFYKLSA